MMKVVLTAGEDRLVIEADGGKWARCHLLSPQRTVYLGANAIRYILDGLEFAVGASDVLFKDPASLNDFQGHQVRYVLTMFEALPKHILCVADDDTRRLLLWLEDHIDGTGFTLAHVLTLSPSDRQRWQQQLAGMRAELRAAGEKV